MKLNDILKKIGNFGTTTKVIVKESGKIIATEPNLQDTLGFKAGSFEYLAGINAKQYKVESFTVTDHTLIFNVSQ